MADIRRQKYVRIMDEIEDLEDRLEELRRASPGAGDAGPELAEVQERLTERMRELARITDGCSRPGASGR